MTELCTLDLLYFDGVENEEGETRPIFIPNACHVCKAMRHDPESTSNTKLLSCSGCRMIAYCGPAHQKEHWVQHKVFFRIFRSEKYLILLFVPTQDLCKVVQQILRKEGRTSLFSETTKLNLSNESWKAFRYNLMIRAEKSLSVIFFIFDYSLLLIN